MSRLLALCLVLVAGAAWAGDLPALDRTQGVAFLGIVFLDTSTEGDYFGARPEEAARVGLLESEVRDRFAAEGFTLMDLAPIAEDIDRVASVADCYGCEVRMAEKLGAGYVVVGLVQKVSNLILAMNLVMREVPGGEMVRGQTVDIRANTDDSWLRGIRYILKNHYFREGT